MKIPIIWYLSNSYLTQETQAVLDRVIAYADSYANWAIDNVSVDSINKYNMIIILLL